MLYDTHVHFDILIERLGLIKKDFHKLNESSWKVIDRFISKVDKDNIKFKLNQLCINHEFSIQSTVSLKNFHICNNLFSELKNYHIMLGLHPEIITERFDLNSYLAEQRLYLEQNNLEIIAIGEIGLDYFYDANNEVKNIQKTAVIEMIQLANMMNLPCIFHIRGKDGDQVWDDFFEILDSFRPTHGFIIHCFTGGLEEMDKVVKRGGNIGIGGICTFKNAKNLQEAIQNCPIENIVLETDLPYLAPIPYRGKTCLPAYVENVADKIAELKKLNKKEVLKTTLDNSKKIFRLS